MSKANLLGKNWNWLNIRVSSNKAETMEYFKSTGLLLISCLRMCMYVRTLASRYRASEWVTMRKFVWKFPRHDDTRTIENKWNISNSNDVSTANRNWPNKPRSGWIFFVELNKTYACGFFSFSWLLYWVASHRWLGVCFPYFNFIFLFAFVFIAFTLFWYIYASVWSATVVTIYSYTLVRTHIVLNILKNASRFHSNKSIKISTKRCKLLAMVDGTSEQSASEWDEL